MDFTLDKRKFKDVVIHLRYDWQISDIPSSFACEDVFDVDNCIAVETWKLHYSKTYELRDFEA